MGFVFYDTETTGLNTRFDQILQFAAIHTDENLNELDRLEVRCKLLPHIVPSPKALCVTKVSIEQITNDQLLSHYEMMLQVNEKMTEWSPSIFTGWNTIEFDEHLLRQSFYQCLLPLYLTNTSGSGRIDILKLVQAVSVFDPSALKIPLNQKGSPSFKLDMLAPENGFNHDKAHDAMGDVEATIHMCREIRKNAPDHWNNYLRFSLKASISDFLETELAFVLTVSYFGRTYQYPLTSIGFRDDDPTATYSYNLAVDPETLKSLNDDELASRLSRSPKPIRRVKANSAPILNSVDDFDRLGDLDSDEILTRAEAVKADKNFCDRLISLCPERDVFETEFVEEQIYDSFFSAADKNLMNKFHSNDWPHRFQITENFEDERLRKLGRRLILCNYPNGLPDEIRSSEIKSLAQRSLGYGIDKPKWTVFPEALLEIEKCKAEYPELETTILGGVEMYLNQRSKAAEAELD